MKKLETQQQENKNGEMRAEIATTSNKQLILEILSSTELMLVMTIFLIIFGKKQKV